MRLWYSDVPDTENENDDTEIEPHKTCTDRYYIVWDTRIYMFYKQQNKYY